MNKYYVSAKIANLDIGAEVEAENQFMAGLLFKETYDKCLYFGKHCLVIEEVEER